MSTLVKDAAAQLVQALKLVPGISSGAVYTDPGAAISSAPAVVLGPPSLLFETGCVEPTGARFPVYAVVDSNERAMERLWELVPEVSAAIDEHTGGVVVAAEPFSFPQGTTDLPSYQLIVEVGL